MSTKRLKNLFFLTLMTLVLAAPFHVSQAAFFDSRAVIDLINKERVQRDIKPLEIDKELTQAATEKANDMFLHNYFDHVSPSGVTPWQWIGQSGYDYSFAGENLAINFSDPKSQHEALMKSESHKKNILNSNYKEIGVAVIKGKMNGNDTIITVQEFGAKIEPVSSVKSATDISNAKSAGLSSQIPLTENVQENFSNNLNTAKNILYDISENISPDPFISFVYFISLAIALAFFMHELFAMIFPLAVHLFSFRKKPKILQTKSGQPLPLLLPSSLRHFLHLEKIYLTHMKLKR